MHRSSCPLCLTPTPTFRSGLHLPAACAEQSHPHAHLQAHASSEVRDRPRLQPRARSGIPAIPVSLAVEQRGTRSLHWLRQGRGVQGLRRVSRGLYEFMFPMITLSVQPSGVWVLGPLFDPEDNVFYLVRALQRCACPVTSQSRRMSLQ